MPSITSITYISHTRWLHDAAIGENVILRGTSALEYLGLFNGYLNERKIYVYSKSVGIYENFDYRVVDTFDNIETVLINGIRCTSVNQTMNDLLFDYDNTDDLAFIEALSNYYFAHDESFDGLKIAPENLPLFNRVKEYAKEYYNED